MAEEKTQRVSWPEHCLHGNGGKPCRYRGYTAATPSCDYALHAGRCRRVPLGACIHWADSAVGRDPTPERLEKARARLAARQKDGAREMASGRALYTPERLARLRIMVEHHMTDREIAAALGIRRELVGNWRRRLKLPAQYPKEREDRWTRAGELYAEGKWDHEIAAEIGVSKKAVWDWRHKHKLPPQARKGRT